MSRRRVANSFGLFPLVILLAVALPAAARGQITRPELKSISAPAYVAGGGIGLTEAIANDLATLKVDMMRVEFIGQNDADKSICYTAYDRIVDRLAARQIKVLGLIDYQSIAWASETDWETAAFRLRFVARVQEIVGRYSSRTNPIRHWEIWNEEDLCVAGYCPRIEPQFYGPILVDVYHAIKAIDPGATVVLGGISPKGFEYPPSNYLSDLYGTTALQNHHDLYGYHPFDAVGAHPYPEIFSSPNPGLANVLDNYVKAVMNANGDAAKKVWLTEMGWNSSSVSEANQATYLTQSYQMMDTHTDPAYPGNGPYVERYFWFHYVDFGAVDFWGLKRANLSAKPAYTAYMNLGPSSVTKPIPPPEGSMPGLTRESAADPLTLSIQPDSTDPLNGLVATRLSGGFHPANTNPADHEPAFTDGAGLGALTGLLDDFPGQNTPAWSGFWPLAGGSRVNLGEVRVFSGNAGKDGRVFHHYDLYVTSDPAPSASSAWTLLRPEVTSAPFGTSNASHSIQAMLTRLSDPGGGNLAAAITALRLDFYAVSGNDDLFRDDWDACTGTDCDGAGAAFQSPLIYEVDAYFVTTPTLDLAISKDDGQATAVPGTPVTYTITVTNTGPAAVTGATVTDTLPVSLTGATWTCAASPGSSCSPSGSGNILDTINLLAGGTTTYALTADIGPFARDTLVNSATVTPPAGVIDTNSLNDLAKDTDTLEPLADVQIVKTDDVDPAPLGGLLTYTFTVKNNGPSGATSVSVQDPLPADMNLDTVPGAIPPQCSYSGPTRTVSCDLANLGPADVATVAIKVRPQAVRLFTNIASVTRSEPDPASANNSEDETTLVEVSSLDVRFFTVTSTNENNVLEWVNPTADYSSTEIVVRKDRYPSAPGDGDPSIGGNPLYSGGLSGERVKLPHSTPGSNGVTYYYAAFVHRSVAPFVSPGRFCTGRPFATTGPVKWAFSTGATALSPPTVGGAGVIAPANDRVLYAMERGLTPGGVWPDAWTPIELGDVVQSRSPIVPIQVGTANPVVYLGSQDGSIYAVDATTGGKAWGPTSVGPMVQAAPAGIFSAFKGLLNYLLVGTRDGTGPNAFVALNPYTGGLVESYTNGGAGPGAIGIVNGMAAVDYGPPLPPRVYFTSYERTPVGSTTTLWCFDLKTSPDPVFNFRWGRALGNIDGGPVLRGGRVYVGSAKDGGTVYSIDALTGGGDRTFPHGNGQVKGFVFPDRSSRDIYFATNDFVWGVTDNDVGMVNKFGSALSLGAGVKPSPVLFIPGSHYLYVGGSDGSLYQFNLLGGPLESVTLGDGKSAVGAPSLDRDFNLVHVGSEAGIFYAVAVPLPAGATCVQAAACSVLNVGQPCYNLTPTPECSASACLGPGVCGP